MSNRVLLPIGTEALFFGLVYNEAGPSSFEFDPSAISFLMNEAISNGAVQLVVESSSPFAAGLDGVSRPIRRFVTSADPKQRSEDRLESFLSPIASALDFAPEDLGVIRDPSSDPRLRASHLMRIESGSSLTSSPSITRPTIFSSA
jgi:hypothetical protein